MSYDMSFGEVLYHDLRLVLEGCVYGFLGADLALAR